MSEKENDTINPEEVEVNNENTAEEVASETKELSLEEQLAAANAEIASLKDAVLRSMAEAENIRRRAEKEKSDARAYGIEKFARDLLPIADTLGRALSHISEEQRKEDAALNTLAEGIELTEKELYATFDRNSIKKVGIQGEKFDPNVHQAVSQVPSAIQKDHIAMVFQPGFTLSGRVLRAAMVAVSLGE